MENNTVSYQKIGQALQIEGNHVNADKDFLSQQGMNIKHTMSRQEGVNAFNQIAEQNDLNPLRDPLGYMKLNDNAYDTLHDQYKNQYQNAADSIDAGMMAGGSYGMRGVLKKLNPTIRHDMKPFLPGKMKYSDLRFVKATPEIKNSAKNLAHTRVRLTYSYGIKRSVEQETFDNLKQKLNQTGLNLSKQIVKSLQDPKQESNKLSSAELLKNSGNNKDALQLFAKQLKNPDSIDKPDGYKRPQASFKTGELPFAKFLLKNKKYLKNHGFEVKKDNAEIVTTWQSDHIDKLYQKTQNDNKSDNLKLNLSGLNTMDNHSNQL